MIKKAARRDDIAVLSASQGVCLNWIPAFAGMTGFRSIRQIWIKN
jgi:hypothetical protein